MIVFLSDNGLLWGEHRIWNRKNAAYEESIRIPLIIRYDPLVDAPRSNDELVGNVDLAPTFAAVAGIPAPGAQGKSLLPLLTAAAGDPPPWRKRLVIEHLKGQPGTGDDVPTYCAVRSDRFKYVVYSTHEEELYDLLADPAELDNRAADPTLRATKFGLRADVHRLCNPSPPGFDLAWLCTLEPAPGATSVTGTAAAETICGRKASEVLQGRGGNDVVRGERGDDRALRRRGTGQADRRRRQRPVSTAGRATTSSWRATTAETGSSAAPGSTSSSPTSGISSRATASRCGAARRAQPQGNSGEWPSSAARSPLNAKTRTSWPVPSAGRTLAGRLKLNPESSIPLCRSGSRVRKDSPLAT